MRSRSVDGFVVEGHHAFGVELAERHLEPGSVSADLVHAVELEVEQFTDAQPAGAGQQQGVGGEAVVGSGERVGEPAVSVDGQVARQRLRESGDVAAEQQPSWWGVGPSPLADVGEEAGDGEDAAGLIGAGQWTAGGGADGGGDGVQVGLDVAASVESGQRRQRRVDVGEEATEVCETGGQAGHRLGSAGAQLAFQVGDERRP